MKTRVDGPLYMIPGCGANVAQLFRSIESSPIESDNGIFLIV